MRNETVWEKNAKTGKNNAGIDVMQKEKKRSPYRGRQENEE